MPNKLYTVPQLAEMLSVTEWTIREWIKSGKIVGMKVGNQWRVSEDALEDYFRRNNG